MLFKRTGYKRKGFEGIVIYPSGIFLQGIGEYETARTVRQRNGIVDLKEAELCRSWIRDYARPLDLIS